MGLLKKFIKWDELPNLIGIDFSVNTLKIVELNPQSYQIRKHSINNINTSNSSAVSAQIDYVNTVGQFLALKFAEMQLACKCVAFGVPYKSIISKTIKLPLFDSQFEQYQYVAQQISQILNIDIANIGYDFNLSKVDGFSITNALVVALNRDKIDELDSIAILAGLQLSAIYVENFVVYNLISDLSQINNICLFNFNLILDISFGTIKLSIVNDKDFFYATEFVVTDQVNEKSDQTSIIHMISVNIKYAIDDMLANYSLKVEEFSHVFVHGLALSGYIIALRDMFGINLIEISDLLHKYNPNIGKDTLNELVIAIALAKETEYDKH